MPVKKDSSGRRSVEAETEVQGTPEEVWQAIASGPGISSWFVPTTLDGRVGGKTTSNFGPGMDSEATITQWQPPHRFVAEAPEGPGTVATEWSVEAKGGGTCTVRVVHSWFASTDDWDGQFEGHAFGWIGFFQILQQYLAHFAGQPSTLVPISAMTSDDLQAAWYRLVRPMGLADATPGMTIAPPPDAPPLGGTVEAVNPPQWPGMLLRLDSPAPALAHLIAVPMGQTMLSLRFYLYGQAGAAKAAEVQSQWQDWLSDRFPMG